MTGKGPIIALLEKLRIRTAMYIGSRSITRLRTYIDGYGHGLDDSNFDSHDPEYYGFQGWIERRYRSQTSHGWDQLILFYCQDERDALDQFWTLLDEYLAECRGANPEPDA